MSDARGSGFLRRWARRKQKTVLGRTPPPAESASPSTLSEEVVGTLPAAPAPGGEPPALLSDADMPPLESLGADSDFAQFLSDGVSDALRRQALRKLFAQPEFGVLDGLNDYDDDYTQLAPLGDTVTYQMKRWLQRDDPAKTEHAELAAAPDTEPELQSEAGPGSPGRADPAAQEEADG